MLARALRGLAITLLAGVMAFLPLVLTGLLVGWVVETLHAYIGPGSALGGWLQRLGLSVVTSAGFSWAAGVVLLVAALWFTGLLIRAHLLDWAFALLDQAVQRIPLIGPVYGLASRFARLLGPRQGTDLRAMAPVWCLFGGQGGTAVLALLPNPEVVVIQGARYRPVLIPSAPVPVGGGLLFLPEAWVSPADLGIEDLTSLYVSMGVALPPGLTRG